MRNQPPESGPLPSTDAGPPLGRYYEAAGRRLLLHRSGSEGPAVVFLAGGGAVGLDYWNVQDRAAKLSTSVVYDRAGTGWSERAPLPRTSAEVTDELRELLRAAGVPVPYLLVGHSLGGLYARHYATRFPGEVVGLLLLTRRMRTTTRTCRSNSTRCAATGTRTRCCPRNCPAR
jgi:pimeloyl-ACP methyl ester carboxylesterase